MSEAQPSIFCNAAIRLLADNLAAWPDRTALIDDGHARSYRQLADRADAFGCALLAQGLRPGDRIALCQQDGLGLVSGFLGAIKVGLLPMPLNTLLTAADYAMILSDSGAAAAVVSEPLSEVWRRAVIEAGWTGRLWIDAPPGPVGQAAPAIHPSLADDHAFLLYSSGSTGRPKGVVHRHGSLGATAELYGKGVLGLRQDDVIYSAAKLFFAYGLGNSLTFPLSVGATCVLRPDRVTPEVVWQVLRDHAVTVFFGVPTLFAALLASPAFPQRDELSLRLCASAGEPLPADIARAWLDRTGVEIIDGIGSTEMLHVFVSNRPGQMEPGVTGRPAHGYEVRLVGDDGLVPPAGELGELEVRGPSAAAGYWNNPEKTAATFVDGWVRTGDKFRLSPSGALVYGGRADDMLKVSGIWVSPAEVESALIGHHAVQEAAVIGVPDAHGLAKVRAYVVLRPDIVPSEDLAEQLRAFARSRLTPHKYPRQIEFVTELPKTATGKIQRHVLRDRAAEAAR